MNWAALIPIAIKYGPLIFAFIQTQGPGIQSFIQEIEAGIKAARNPDGSMNWPALLPLVFKYAPQIFTFLHNQGVPIQTVISDFMGALKGQPVAASAAIPSAVLSGPNFVFPGQTVAGSAPAAPLVGGFSS